jgi:pimeloyl-ACP methyl ester carboxylesterase
MRRVSKQRSRPFRQLLTAALLLAVLPVFAQSRSLQMTLDGRTTTVDIVSPTQSETIPIRGAVILVHGFTRDRTVMAGHAEALAREGFWVIVPDLPYVMDSRDNARALRDLMQLLRKGAAGPSLDRIVLVGHSAGGLAALLAANAPGVVGYIGLDPFDRPSGVGLDAAKVLTTPVYLLRGPSSFCNAYAIAAPWVKAFPNLVEDRQLAAASHCDFESNTDWICQAACGDVDPRRQAVVREFILSAARHLLPATGAPRTQSQVDHMPAQAQQQPHRT